MGLPERNWLYHATPNWIRDSDNIFFITICCKNRGVNSLANESIAPVLLASIRDRQKRALWYPHIVVFMPDHLHGLFSFADYGTGMTQIVAKWKEWQARNHGIQWQKGFFDHRLRSDESYDEKESYIRNNPVRAGLVDLASDWPYIYEGHLVSKADGP